MIDCGNYDGDKKPLFSQQQEVSFEQKGEIRWNKLFFRG